MYTERLVTRWFSLDTPGQRLHTVANILLSDYDTVQIKAVDLEIIEYCFQNHYFKFEIKNKENH
jgi:hypothetical protein